MFKNITFNCVKIKIKYEIFISVQVVKEEIFKRNSLILEINYYLYAPTTKYICKRRANSFHLYSDCIIPRLGEFIRLFYKSINVSQTQNLLMFINKG